MDKVRDLFRKTDAEPEYEPISNTNGHGADEDDDMVRRPVMSLPEPEEAPFSWFEYSIFLLLGIAMLWAW